MDWLSGQLDNHPRYEQIAFLRSGAFGSVIVAEDKLAGGELVALKFIKRSQVGVNGFAESEILNHMRLRHPHVISLHEVFLTEDYLVLVLEYAAGGDLSALLPAGQGLPEAQAQWLFQQILFALDYCHSMGVASRDIKAENILVLDSSPLPIVKLADWGLSADQRLGPVRYCGAIGTPTYFAPEMITMQEGQLYDAQKTDVWACGVLLHVLLTGCCPFQRASDAQLGQKERMQALLQRIKAVDYRLPAWLPEDCKNLISRMLVADPSKRPSVHDLLLHPWCSGPAGKQGAALLEFNASFLASSLASPWAPEVVREVYSILDEASIAQDTPRGCISKANMVGDSSACSCSQADCHVNQPDLSLSSQPETPRTP